MHGDLLTNLHYRAQLAYHRSRQSWLTIGAHRKDVKIDLGILELDGDGTVTGYREKPTLSYPVSMGVYVYEPTVLEWIAPGEYLDFPDLVLRLLVAGKKVVAFPNDACWLDLGRYEDLKSASDLFLERRHEFLPPEPSIPRKAAA
jgi:NDP-sugar pyrophosphorylase family protein